MSTTCLKISICLCFFVFSYGLFYLSQEMIKKARPPVGYGQRTLKLLPWIKCVLGDYYDSSRAKTPSLESFIRASTTVEGQELRLSGLAVFSKLTNACQPLADARKSDIRVNKIALVSLENETVCQFQDLAVNAQNAGYTMAIYFAEHVLPSYGKQTNDILLIPVFQASRKDCYWVYANQKPSKFEIDDSDLEAADRNDVEITGETGGEPELTKMGWYLARLYGWFFLGPVITLEWLRRKKKLCCMSRSGGPQVDEHHANDDEETAIGETGQNTVAAETQGNRVGNYDEAAEHEQNGGEEQSLVNVTRQTRHIASLRLFITFFGKMFAVFCGYAILIVAALPVGISSGGWSFFRFDEGEIKMRQDIFWDNFVSEQWADILFVFLPLWWSPLQIVCFFLYSRFACKTTWTTSTHVSKLIRSDWFASNIYLLILGLVVPYCFYDFDSVRLLIYFTTNNTVCTVCNLLFIIILNKHKFVTTYVFYISVCMICAYVESDIVAVFYFMLNSEGSLINLKLTALRTLAIGLTLTLSFSTSMHIIRKLTKPRESLFEGLAEK